MNTPHRSVQSDYATVAELAQRLHLSRRGALNLLNSCATQLRIPIHVAGRNQLQISRADFERVVELANALRSAGLNIRQVQTLRQSTSPLLWALLSRSEETSSSDVSNIKEEAVSRIEASLTDFLQRQETVMKQQLDLLHHVVSLLPAAPAPTPTPVPAPARREPRE
ncbi:hypothetical protein [Deinococcus sp. UR1]|uniref:hypothetical protein n=1 Tax=Deinococcus sp. UR1 TaxID=1704277 RepID=UPI0011AEFA5C|nr:hypothetical protein [Deinococcus sp. UR1]